MGFTNLGKICWRAFTTSINKQINNKIRILQFLYDKIPVGCEMNKRMANYDSTCQACNNETETVLHMFQCINWDYVDWCQVLFRKLHLLCQRLELNPILIEILMDRITAGFDNENLDITAYSMQYAFLVQDQNSIGWINYFEGLWTSQWIIDQDIYLGETKRQHAWISTIVSFFWANWLELWMLCNGYHHGKETETKKKRRKEILSYQLEKLYLLKNEIKVEDRTIYRHLLVENLQESPHCIQALVNIYSPVIQLSMEELKQKTKTNDIREYYIRN